ncbi:MAG: class I SAM-dependent methyltransferase [Lacipirellulaceae bacterium]
MSLAVVQQAEFDAYSQEYEAALSQGLKYSGEGPGYFARKRIEWTARLLERCEGQSAQVLDFGCGVGLATEELNRAFGELDLWGYDPSIQAIARATQQFGGANARFTADETELPAGTIDLAYTNGVFHHIPPAARANALRIVHNSLKPGGWFAFWENNPWNPGTRFVMSRVPFDRDAVTITPPEARGLLREAGFEIERTDAWFIFPKSLAWLRPLESLVHRLPLGGQYLVLARKAEEAS